MNLRKRDILKGLGYGILGAGSSAITMHYLEKKEIEKHIHTRKNNDNKTLTSEFVDNSDKIQEQRKKADAETKELAIKIQNYLVLLNVKGKVRETFTSNRSAIIIYQLPENITQIPNIHALEKGISDYLKKKRTFVKTLGVLEDRLEINVSLDRENQVPVNTKELFQ